MINKNMMNREQYFGILIILVILSLTGCQKIVEPVESNESSCSERAVFGNPADSEYILPFSVGKSFVCGQSYCYRNGGHKNQLSYDFNMEIGDEVIAARSGRVFEIKQDSPDNGQGEGEHNYVIIEHEDGTMAFYAHLQQNCVTVKKLDLVEAGDLIGYSGNSGLTGGAHLHFGVYRDYRFIEGDDIPVNFRNPEGLLDSKGGLIMFETYLALPY